MNVFTTLQTSFGTTETKFISATIIAMKLIIKTLLNNVKG